MKIRNNKIGLKIIILFIISLIGFYFLNLYTGIIADDLAYKFIFNTVNESDLRSGVRVESISDIFISQYNHYFFKNGRILIHGLVQLFLMPENKLWFNIVNTLLFGLFQLLILKRSVALKSTNEYQYLLLIIFLCFLIPDPGGVFLWLDGSVNYMWGIIIVLLFLDFFDRIDLKNLQVKSKYFLLILIFGFLAGFTHEVVTVSVSGALCLGILKSFKNLNKYKVSSLILIFGFLLGTFIMVIAPGNLIRFNSSGPESHTVFYSILQRCLGLVQSTKSLSAFWLMIVMSSVLYVKDRNGFKIIYRKHELLIHSIFISLGFIFLVNGFKPRAFFGISVFSVVVILSILHRYERLFFSNKGKIACIILSVFVIVEYTQGVSELRRNKIVFDADEELWMTSNDLVFELKTKDINRFTSSRVVESNRFSWANKRMSWYYGKDFMIFIPPDLYQNVYKSRQLLVDENLLSNESLKRSSDSIKIYKTTENKFLVYKVPDSISILFSEGSYVNYKSNRVINKNNSSYVDRIKMFMGTNQVSSFSEEVTSCFILPTANGTYLVLNSPLIIPFEHLKEISVYPSKNETTPILNF